MGSVILSGAKNLGVPRGSSAFLCARSNRAFGTHPQQSPYNDAGAVCFLWHFPSNRFEPAVPDVIRHTALRSSDFPLPAPEDAESGRPVRLPTKSL